MISRQGIAITAVLVWCAACIACGAAIGELTKPMPHDPCPYGSELRAGRCIYVGDRDGARRDGGGR